MAITLGNVTTASPVNAGGNTLSVTTHNNNGDFLLVDIGEGYNDVNDITGVTWNGTSMTLIGSVTDPGSGVKLYRYGLVNPATGTRTLIVTFGSSGDVSAMITLRSFSGVNQSTPTGSTVTQTAIAATSISLNVSAASGDVVADAIGAQNGTATTLTPGTGQTQTSNGSSGWGNTTLDRQYATSYKAGAASVTMSWTSSVSKNLWMLATAIKPASSGTNYTLTLSGSLNSSGNVNKGISAGKSGASNFSGALQKNIGLIKSGVVNSSGALQKGVSLIKSGAFNGSGTIIKAAKITLNGVLSASGSIVTSRFFSLVLSGALSAGGGISKAVSLSKAGAVSFAGALQKSVSKSLNSIFTASGNIISNIIGLPDASIPAEAVITINQLYQADVYFMSLASAEITIKTTEAEINIRPLT